MITKTYTMEESNVKKLQSLKERKGVSMAWLVNRAVEEYFERHNVLD